MYVDFVACYPSNRQFFRLNRRISRIILRGLVTLLASSAQPQRRRKRENKQNKNSEQTCRTVFGRFLWRHCKTNNAKLDCHGRLRFRRKYPYQGSSVTSIQSLKCTLSRDRNFLRRLTLVTIMTRDHWSHFLSYISRWKINTVVNLDMVWIIRKTTYLDFTNFHETFIRVSEENKNKRKKIRQSRPETMDPGFSLTCNPGNEVEKSSSSNLRSLPWKICKWN